MHGITSIIILNFIGIIFYTYVLEHVKTPVMFISNQYLKKVVKTFNKWRVVAQGITTKAK